MFGDVRLPGHQDTFSANAGGAYFHRSATTGSVDFVFGAGVAMFDSCETVSRDRGSATDNGYITAVSTARSQPYGLPFIHTRVTKGPPAPAPNSVSLGRPRHPSADAAIPPSVAFVDCWMDDHLGARGWDRMGMTDSPGQRVWAEPESARFSEYGTRGPGAVPGPNRRVLNDAEAGRYTISAALAGWTPPARTPSCTPLPPRSCRRLAPRSSPRSSRSLLRPGRAPPPRRAPAKTTVTAQRAYVSLAASTIFVTPDAARNVAVTVGEPAPSAAPAAVPNSCAGKFVAPPAR